MQSPEVFRDSQAGPNPVNSPNGGSLREEGATIMGRMLTRRLYRGKRRVLKDMLGGHGVVPRTQAREWYLRDQFGDNWGKDPRSIRY